MTPAELTAFFASVAAVNTTPPPPVDTGNPADVIDRLNETLGHTPLAVVLTGRAWGAA